MGSLKPEVEDFPKFMQLYIVDTENEVLNRENALRYTLSHLIVWFIKLHI